MMREYKRAVEEGGETNRINAEVLENWELLVKKYGDTKRYRDAFLKDECVYMVERAIADFGVQHGIDGQALTDYVSGALHERINGSNDGFDPYCPLEGYATVDWSDEMDESNVEDGDSGDDEDGDSDSSDE